MYKTELKPIKKDPRTKWQVSVSTKAEPVKPKKSPGWDTKLSFTVKDRELPKEIE